MALHWVSRIASAPLLIAKATRPRKQRERCRSCGVDTALGRIVAAVRAQGGALLVTADHGNCELMKDPVTGGPHTAHTTNPVPVLLAGGPPGATLADGRLADVAPTLLALMGQPQPAAMTGVSLLRRP